MSLGDFQVVGPFVFRGSPTIRQLEVQSHTLNWEARPIFCVEKWCHNNTSNSMVVCDGATSRTSTLILLLSRLLCKMLEIIENGGLFTMLKGKQVNFDKSKMCNRPLWWLMRLWSAHYQWPILALSVADFSSLEWLLDWAHLRLALFPYPPLSLVGFY